MYHPRIEAHNKLVQPVIAYVMAGALVGGFFMGLVPAEAFVPVAVTVVTFFYQKPSDK